MALIFALSARPNLSSGLGGWDTLLRKGAHLTEYAVLWALWCRALHRPRAEDPRAIVLATVIALAYAATDEWHQSHVTGRHGSPVDWLIDAGGIGLGVAFGIAWMRRRVRAPAAALTTLLLLLGLAACGGNAADGGTAAGAPPADGPPLHVALGDSLAVGVQPAPDGERVEAPGAYPERLVALRRRQVPGLTLAQLGCGGATTASTIAGGKACAPARRSPYAERASPLAYAERLLRTGRVRSLSIDIGANDLLPCLRDLRRPDQACLARATTQAGADAAVIARRLRRAGGPEVPMAFLPVHDPYLAAWLLGADGRRYAADSVRVIARINQREAKAFRAQGFRIADVDTPFATRVALTGPQVALAGHGRVPRAVQRACTLSWACAEPPRGPDVHLTDAGQAAFAEAAAAALDG